MFIDSTIFHVPENKTKYSSSSFDSSRDQARTFGNRPEYFAKLRWKVAAISKHYILFLPISSLSISCSLFPRAFFLRFIFIWLTPNVLRETLSRYPNSQHSAFSDIPCFFTLFFPPKFHLFSSSSTPVVLFSTLFFSLLSFILSFSFFLSPHTLHFSLPRFIPLNVHDSKDFYNLQYFISDHFYSLTHIPTSLTGVLGRQIYRQLYWGCTRVKCHRSKFLVCRRRCRVNIAFVTRTSWFIFRVEVIRRPP